MSVGNIKEDNDKKGDICKVVDIIIAPKIEEAIAATADLKVFFAELVANYIMQKHKIEINPTFSMPKI